MLIGCKKSENNSLSLNHWFSVQQDTVTANLLELNPVKGLVYYKNEPFTGVSATYMGDDKLFSTIDYVDGKKHGSFKKWYPDGTLSYQGNYVLGKKQGYSKSWWKNGVQRSEANFEKGVAHGIQLQWYKSGAKFKRLHLNYGKEEGLQQSWRENGKLYCNYEARNGRIFGLKRANLCYELEDENVKY